MEDGFFDLDPGKSHSVKVTVSVPWEVELGGHYAALFFETVPLEAPQGTSVTITGRMPPLFYLTIPGVTEADVVANAEIVSLLLPDRVEKGPAEVGVVVHNTGNVHLTIAAEAYFSDSWRGGVGELDLGQMVVLPNSERTIKGNWEEMPLFGKIKASFVIGYFDRHGELVNKTETGRLWIIPWKLGIIIAVIVCFLGLLIWRGRKRYHLRIERR